MARKENKQDLADWQRDHWRAVALCDLIMTAHTEAEETSRLVELRKIKKQWGHTLTTGYDPNYIRSRESKPAEKLSKDRLRTAEEYVPASGGVGKGSSTKATGRVHGTSHAK